MGEVLDIYQTLVDRVDARHTELKEFQRSITSFDEIYAKAWTCILQLGKLQRKIGPPESWKRNHPSYNSKTDLYFTIMHVRQFWYCELAKAGYINRGGYNFE